MLPLTNKVKQRIRLRVKNKLDVSALIMNINIKGADLSNAIIKDFTRMKEDISNIDLTNATIGKEGKVNKICDCKLFNSMFVNTKFIGKWFFRRNNCKNSNFNGAWMHNTEYQYTDFTNCTFCEAIVRVGTEFAYKCKLDINFFKDLVKGSNLKITLKEE